MPGPAQGGHDVGGSLRAAQDARRQLAEVLSELGLTDRFACILGGDTLAEAKPSPMPIREMVKLCGGGRTAFVGDSIFDIQAGQAAGLPTIACSFGFLMQPVDELGAEAVIDGFDALIPALDDLARRTAA